MAQDDKKKKKKFTLYRLFNPEGNGKGLTKEEAAQPRTFINFFKFFWRNIGVLFTVNIYLVLGNFPILITMLGLTGNFNGNSTAASSLLFGPLYGTMHFAASGPVTGALYGVHGVQSALSVPSVTTIVLYCLGILVIFTYGVVNVGTAYILRNLVKGEPVFIWDDFWYAIKRNWKQGLILGIIDALLTAMIAFDLVFFFANIGTILSNLLFGVMVLIAVTFITMRFYMYTIMVTFDLSLYKILKNSFIFSILGLKRNAVALLGIAAAVVLNWGLSIAFMPLGIILPFVITFAAIEFMGIYAAYPKIKEIMIDPYYESDRPDAKKIMDETETVFTDKG